MTDLNLPDGFDDAPRDVQAKLLETHAKGSELSEAIADELGMSCDRGSLRKEHKAVILLELCE